MSFLGAVGLLAGEGAADDDALDGLTKIELSVLSRQCLHRRVPDFVTLAREVGAWQARRNTAGITVDWQFTTADARIKLKHLYPTVQE